MKIVSADFIRAAEKKQDYPPGGATEIAFAGRSNVGKSSMINALLGRRNLVRTSKTPGHTRKLNFYLINDRFIFVDFPGYGYAKVPLSVKGKWGPMVETYLAKREELAGVVVIVDARRPPTESDMSLVDYLQSRAIPFIVAATKADKLSRGQMAGYRRLVKEQVGEKAPVVLFSSYNGEGKKELWREINALME
jgi:GTP-binding protein